MGNLNPTRDFTYVEDTANAYLSTIKNNNISGETINLGNNFEVSIKSILKILKEDFGYKFDVIIDKKRVRAKNSEVDRLFASNSKAKKYLNGSLSLVG